MDNKKTKIMPYVFVCGSGIMNLVLMSLPFLNNHGANISGYVLISYEKSILQIFITVFQVLIMLLAFSMLFYGAIGILYTAGVTGVDMSNKKYRHFCAFPIVLMNILYVVQFILITVSALNRDIWIGIGIYMAFFLNLGITIINVVLLKEPAKYKQVGTARMTIRGERESKPTDSNQDNGD